MEIEKQAQIFTPISKIVNEMKGRNIVKIIILLHLRFQEIVLQSCTLDVPYPN